MQLRVDRAGECVGIRARDVRAVAAHDDVVDHWVADREARPAWSLPEGKPRGAGGIAADVDGKGVKRTSQAIVLKVNEISAFGANEMHGVKVFVM